MQMIKLEIIAQKFLQEINVIFFMAKLLFRQYLDISLTYLGLKVTLSFFSNAF